MKKKKGTL